MSSTELAGAAYGAVHDVMGVQPGEQVVVVADRFVAPRIADALLTAATALGATATLVGLPPRERPSVSADPNPKERGTDEQPGEQPTAQLPPPVVAAMAAADVVFELAHPIVNNVDGERDALAHGARVLRMLLFDFYQHVTLTRAQAAEIEGAFIRAHQVDIPATARLTRSVCTEIARAGEVRITSDAGTDLVITAQPVLENPTNYTSPSRGPNPVQCLDGECHLAGTWDECAGGNVGLICANAAGTIVIDHSIPPLGLLREPITLHVADRRVCEIEGGSEATRLRRWLASYDHPDVLTCPAEWGVGTHAGCIDSGNFLEHEKRYGAVHIALGDDRRFGGDSAAPIHIDGVLRDARVELDGRAILADGSFQL